MKLQIDDLGHVTIGVEDWDINLSFDRLTLTTDYSTWITYISRKKVPAGIPITDINYWKPIGRLKNDLVFNYQEFKDEIREDIHNYSNVITAYNNKIKALDNVISSFLSTSSGGEAFSTQFGNSQVMGITQKTLTDAFKNVYKILEKLRDSNTLVVVKDTPYGKFDNMLITSVNMKQEETTDVSRLVVQLKQYNSVSTELTKIDSKKYATRCALQQAATEDLGNMQGKRMSILRSAVSPNIVPYFTGLDQ